MKQKRWVIPFALAMAGMAAGMAATEGQGNSLILLALPFRWLGLGLRALSLSGTAGNFIAIILFVLLSLLPLLPVLRNLRRKVKAPLENIVCIAAAAVLPFLLYRFVNPQLITGAFNAALPDSAEMREFGEVTLSIVFWSLLAAYLVLRALRICSGTAASRGIRSVLNLLLAAMLVSVCYLDLYGLISGIIKTAQGGAWRIMSISAPNSLPEVNPAADLLLNALRFAGSAIPKLLLLRAFPGCFKLLAEIEKDRFAEGNAALALTIAKRARTAIIVSVLLAAGGNLVQLLLANQASAVDISVNLPLFELLIAFLMLVLSEGFRKGFELADENRQFV